ncbi:GNAT family N-acetyltransferase [Deferrisoma camini]|uniref:GNAT family N-acetyltransferase n=1 Tax=Deferrisoma camini TaxID=1035120 RepID=UPI00046CF97C|nr:GNAT family N-acetyltransferase [Deferrisoma camini]NOY45484.1 GNAT family N-acetyltransferase [Deltaproteobacteria bacterium]
MEAVTVRPARPDDVPALCRLLEQLFRLEADFASDPARQARGLAWLLAADPRRAQVFVAEAAGRPVGMVSVQVLISTAEGGEVGLLEDLVVDEGFRGRGIGATLLEAAEAWAHGRGLLRLQLLADRDNAPALRFYRHRRWHPTRLLALRRAGWAVRRRG